MTLEENLARVETKEKKNKKRQLVLMIGWTGDTESRGAILK